MKKIISLVLALVMLVSVFAVLPVAAETDTSEDGVYVYLDEGFHIVFITGGVETEIAVAAKEMANYVTDGTYTISIQDYAKEIISDGNQTEATVNLLNAMLNYGRAAADYFNYIYFDPDEGNIAIEGTPVTDTTALLEANAPAATVLDAAGIYIGATLVLEGTMKLRFYFAGTDITATVDGAAATATAAEGYSYVEVPVMPYEMSKSVTVQVGDTTVTYAPINYLQNKATDATLSTMVASIYAYGIAAEVYANIGVCDHDSLVFATTTLPTVFTTGIESANCPVCEKNITRTLATTKAAVNTITTTNKTNTPYETASIGEALGDKTFGPGNDMYLEYSVLWNSTMSLIAGNGWGWGHIANKADVTNEDSSMVKKFSWLYYRPDTKWCPYVGGFEFSESVKEFAFGPAWKQNSTSEDDFTIIEGLDGWHRIGLQYHQNVYENDGSFTYDVTVTLYVDGVKTNEIILDWGAFFYSAEIVDGKTVYTQNDKIADYYAVFYRLGNGAVRESGNTAYFPFADCYLSVGDGFVINVEPVADPENKVFLQDGAALQAKEYFKVNKYDTSDPLNFLRDDTLEVYEYPMDEIESAGGAIIYWDEKDADENPVKGNNVYHTNFNNNGAGFYQNAFIDITDTVFDYVTLVGNGNKVVGWAFVSEIPEEGEAAKYVGNFATINGFSWGVDKAGTSKIEIPEGANYLVIYYEEAGNSYIPASITFTNEEKIGSDPYYYPMDTLTPANGYINHGAVMSDKNPGTHKWKTTTSGEKYALIDLTDIDYNTVTIYANENNEATNYTFLTKMPTAKDEPISYANGYNDCIWFGLGAGALTVDIPENAKYLAVCYNYGGNTTTVVCPEAIVFSNRENTPINNLRNDKLDSYEYPMYRHNQSMGTIRGTDGVFIPNLHWVTSFVYIEDTVFDRVTFEIDEEYGKISYGFLTEYPTLDKKVSWAGGATGTTEATIANGATVTVDIPEDAAYMVVYWYDWNDSNNTPVYYIPESITFDYNPLVQLQKAETDVFSYPMDEIESAGGAVIYWDEKDADQNAVKGDNVYHTNFNNNGAGFYQNAFIEITDTAYNYVTIISNGLKEAGWAFLAELPEEGEVAQYLGDNATANKFIWTSNFDYTPLNIEIPDGAKYLAIYYEENGIPYLPTSITFSKDKMDPGFVIENEKIDWMYPAEYLVPETTLVHYDTYVYGPVEDKPGWRTATIDLTGLDRDYIRYITLYNHKKEGWMGWTFLAETPVEGEVVTFATGYSKFESASPSNGKSLEIPADAKYLVIWYQDDDATVYCPKTIKFSKKKQ